MFAICYFQGLCLGICISASLLEDIGAVFNAFSTVDFEHKEPVEN